MAREAREGNEGFLTRISRIDTNRGAKRLGVRRQAERDAALGKNLLESVPGVEAKLKAPNTVDEKFEDVVKSAQDAAVLVLVH
jgi:hypothetical protein